MPSLVGTIRGLGGETPFQTEGHDRARREGLENLDAQLAIEQALQNRRRTGIQETGMQARLKQLQLQLEKFEEWKPVGQPKQLSDGRWAQQQFKASTGESRTVALDAPEGTNFLTPSDTATQKDEGKFLAYQAMDKKLRERGTPDQQRQELLDRFWPPQDRLHWINTQQGIVGFPATSNQGGPIPSQYTGWPPGYGSGTPPPNPALDATDMFYVDQLAKGKMTQDMVDKAYPGRNESKRRLIIAEAMQRGFNPNAPLSAAAARDVATAQAQLDINKPLIEEIDRLGLARNNQLGYLAWARLKYGAGIGTAGGLGKDIANLQLTGITSAAAAMKGSTRAWAALNLALQHTPNIWVDSPMQIRQKLDTINQRLQAVMDEQKMYGTKSGMPNPPEGQLPPDRVKVPAPNFP